MLTEKELVKKLHSEAANFRALVKQHQYTQAMKRYKTALDVAVFVELGREELDRLFGDRGEKGVIIQRGAFPEEMVINASKKSREEESKTTQQKYTERQ